ncbi:MAG: alpha-L-rhamnosidase N-terminal domain-containing protein, partial [Verrucomicrobia bacterium]|nr:alpha-L-rhamnosidase N-terminal domain-containing protein [Verrucomicrobiota bacterium]
KPRLSWVIELGDQRTTDRGQAQTAYQILVASTPELLAKDQGDLWDSGKVTSNQSVQVEYAGKSLLSRTSCHWKVRVWLARHNPGAEGLPGEGGDKDSRCSAWSSPALWIMGLLDPADWQAAWVKPIVPAPGKANEANAPAPWVRKVFTLAAAPEQAVAYVNVLGYYELYVNGQKAGDDVLSPAVSDHAKRSVGIALGRLPGCSSTCR